MNTKLLVSSLLISICVSAAPRSIFTDGGRTREGFPYERQDCTVRALALARQISYNEAHGLLKWAGRQDGQGYALDIYLSYQKYAHKLVISKTTIRDFVKTHPLGNYIIRIDGHVFAVKKGNTLDLAGQARSFQEVLGVWIIDPK
jgi:hypothetical protein